ncbi:MAG: MotA/TolQ/ExbB proton channel family protein [Nitrospinota bacterium]
MFEFLAKGGVLMIPLAACSVISLAIIIERALNLRAKRILPGDALQQVRQLLAENQVGEAVILCRRQSSSVGRILLAAISNYDKEKEELKAIVEDAGRQEVPIVDRYLGILGTIAVIAPLLGITGTVFGMIRTFATISEKGVAHPSQLAGGIYEALITTAAGLVIAIPTLTFYNYFTMKSNRLILELEKQAFRVVEILKR